MSSADDIVEIRTVDKAGVASTLRLRVVVGTLCRLDVLEGCSTTTFETTDLFTALQDVRRFYEARGLRLLCKGARPNAIPSAMCISMARGRKVYLMEIGAEPARQNLVDIFVPEDVENIGSVDDQIAYTKRFWEEFRKNGYTRKASDSTIHP